MSSLCHGSWNSGVISSVFCVSYLNRSAKIKYVCSVQTPDSWDWGFWDALIDWRARLGQVYLFFSVSSPGFLSSLRVLVWKFPCTFISALLALTISPCSSQAVTWSAVGSCSHSWPYLNLCSWGGIWNWSLLKLRAMDNSMGKQTIASVQNSDTENPKQKCFQKRGIGSSTKVVYWFFSMTVAHLTCYVGKHFDFLHAKLLSSLL